MDLSFFALAVGWFVKSITLLGVALSVAWFMRRSSAAARHLCLSAAVVAVLVLPLASVALPSWGPSTFPDPFAARHESLTPAPLDGDGLAENSATRIEGHERDGSTAAMPGSEKRWVRWITWFLVLWGGGALILLARLAAGEVYGYRVTTAAPEIEDERLVRAVRQAEERVGVSRSVPVVESDHLRVPFVWGLARPRLILPSEAGQWGSARLGAVVRHELAHVKRRDLVTQFMAQIACCLYWVNPLVWVLERRLLVERERACDDIAIGQDTRPSDYAGYLMESVKELGTPRRRVWPVSAMAEGTDFKDRVLSILDPAAKRNAPSEKQAAAAITLSILLLLPLAAIHPSSRAEGTRNESTSSSVKREASVIPRVRSRTQAWILLLAESDADGREHAASALGRTGDPAAVPALVDALNDPDASVREHVSTALGAIGNDRAAPSLIRVVQSDPHPSVREHAASALGRLGRNDDVYRALVDVYEHDENTRVRAHAAYGLGLMREVRALDLLLEGLNSRHALIRLHCADALGFLGDLRAVPHLQRHLRDEDRGVREAADRALAQIGHSQ